MAFFPHLTFGRITATFQNVVILIKVTVETRLKLYANLLFDCMNN